MFELIHRLLEFPQYKFIIILLAVSYIPTVLTSILIHLLTKKNKSDKTEDEIDVEERLNLLSKKTLVRFMETCILTPYIETILVQWSIFRLVGLIFNGGIEASLIAFYISTLVFAALHIIGGKWYYIFRHMPLSISLAVVFMINDINQTGPVLHTFIFHSLWNTLSIIGLPLIAKIILFIQGKRNLVKTN